MEHPNRTEPNRRRATPVLARSRLVRLVCIPSSARQSRRSLDAESAILFARSNKHLRGFEIHPLIRAQFGNKVINSRHLGGLIIENMSVNVGAAGKQKRLKILSAHKRVNVLALAAKILPLISILSILMD